MKKQLLCFFILIPLLFASCKKPPVYKSEDDLKPVAHVGKVPKEFEKIVENDLFGAEYITASSDRVLVFRYGEDYEPYIDITDLYGNVLATGVYNRNEAYEIDMLTLTDDGGFIYFAGYNRDKGVYDHIKPDGYKCNLIEKYGKDGKIQWELPLKDYSSCKLEFCFEKNGSYYIFGNNTAPGMETSTDICAFVLDADGNIIKTKTVRGDDFDDLMNAEEAQNGFKLHIRSQSDDGDFEGSNSGGYPVYWTFLLDDELNVKSKEIKQERDVFDKVLGEKDGEPVWSSDFTDFDAGYPRLFIDYKDFYLIVSGNATGVYENTPPTISTTWCYWESVYSAYDNDGNLIFRTSVDCSPDYDSIAAKITSP